MIDKVGLNRRISRSVPLKHAASSKRVGREMEHSDDAVRRVRLDKLALTAHNLTLWLQAGRSDVEIAAQLSLLVRQFAAILSGNDLQPVIDFLGQQIHTQIANSDF
jgi:hypothetical protein